MTMKIAAIRATPVNIPFRHAALMSAGRNDQSTRTIIEIETDAGITGLGEASYAFAAQVIEREFAPVLLGLDALDRGRLKRHCLPDRLDFGTPLLKARLAAWGGLDIALWDLLGKALGQPVYRLLGGSVRANAPFVAYSYSTFDADSTPKMMASIAQEAIALTEAPVFEFKVGVHPLDVDIATVLAVHEVLDGRAQIAIDANMGLSYADARRLLREVAPILENVEEPVESLPQMERLACEFNVEVSTHCTELDAVLPYPHLASVPTVDVCGGITGTRRLAQVFGAIGRRVWLRSHSESGIGWAAMVHLGISTPELSRPAQSLIDLIEDDLIEGETWQVRQGGVCPPPIPGLGVSLDRAAIGRCHELFLERGEVQAFPSALRRHSN